MPLEDCSEGDLKSKGKIKLREPLDISRWVVHFTKMKLRLEIGHGEKTKLPKGVQWSGGGRARYAEISLYRHRRNVVPHKHSIWRFGQLWNLQEKYNSQWLSVNRKRTMFIGLPAVLCSESWFAYCLFFLAAIANYSDAKALSLHVRSI